MHEGFLIDHKDLYKFSILRELARRGHFMISTCWMKTSGDGGRKKDTDYLNDPAKWRRCSPIVFDALKKVGTMEEFEKTGLIDDGNYFSDNYTAKQGYWEAFDNHLDHHKSDVIFFDPNTGLGPEYSMDHLPLKKLKHYYKQGYSVMSIQFPPRQKTEPYIWKIFIDTANELEIVTDSAWLFWGKTLNGLTNVFFFLFMREEHLIEPYELRRALDRIQQNWGTCGIIRKSTKDNQHSLAIINGTDVLLKGIGTYSPEFGTQ
jgi:hypothetical protein